jgi:hypothetical protein
VSETYCENVIRQQATIDTARELGANIGMSDAQGNRQRKMPDANGKNAREAHADGVFDRFGDFAFPLRFRKKDSAGSSEVAIVWIAGEWK